MTSQATSFKADGAATSPTSPAAAAPATRTRIMLTRRSSNSPMRKSKSASLVTLQSDKTLSSLNNVVERPDEITTYSPSGKTTTVLKQQQQDSSTQSSLGSAQLTNARSSDPVVGSSMTSKDLRSPRHKMTPTSSSLATTSTINSEGQFLGNMDIPDLSSDELLRSSSSTSIDDDESTMYLLTLDDATTKSRIAKSAQDLIRAGIATSKPAQRHIEKRDTVADTFTKTSEQMFISSPVKTDHHAKPSKLQSTGAVLNASTRPLESLAETTKIQAQTGFQDNDTTAASTRASRKLNQSLSRSDVRSRSPMRGNRRFPDYQYPDHNASSRTWNSGITDSKSTTSGNTKKVLGSSSPHNSVADDTDSASTTNSSMNTSIASFGIGGRCTPSLSLALGDYNIETNEDTLTTQPVELLSAATNKLIGAARRVESPVMLSTTKIVIPTAISITAEAAPSVAPIDKTKATRQSFMRTRTRSASPSRRVPISGRENSDMLVQKQSNKAATSTGQEPKQQQKFPDLYNTHCASNNTTNRTTISTKTNSSDKETAKTDTCINNTGLLSDATPISNGKTNSPPDSLSASTKSPAVDIKLPLATANGAKTASSRPQAASPRQRITMRSTDGKKRSEPFRPTGS